MVWGWGDDEGGFGGRSCVERMTRERMLAREIGEDDSRREFGARKDSFVRVRKLDAPRLALVFNGLECPARRQLEQRQRANLREHGEQRLLRLAVRVRLLQVVFERRGVWQDADGDEGGGEWEGDVREAERTRS